MCARKAPVFRTQVRDRFRLSLVIISTICASLVVSLATLWANAGAASAHFTGNGHYVSGVGLENDHGFWLGALETAHGMSQDEASFCVTMWRGSPDPSSPVTTSVLTAATVQAPEELALTPAQMATAIRLHFAQGDADSRAALAYLGHVNFEGPTPGRNVGDSVSQLISVVRTQLPHIDTLAQGYVQEARAHTPSQFVVTGFEGDGEKGQLVGIGAQSEYGWVAGIPVSITLEGPAVFSETQSPSWTGNTADQPLSLAWHATGEGEVKATLVFSELPRQTLTLVHAGERIQDLITTAARPQSDATSITISTQPVHVFRRFQPLAKSSVGEWKIVDAERDTDVAPQDLAQHPAVATIRDTIEISLEDPSIPWPLKDGKPAPVTFHGTAYRIPRPLETSSPDIPADAQLVGQTHVEVTEPGTYQASIEGVESGFVTWVWAVDKDDAAHDYVVDNGLRMADMIRSTWSDHFGLPEETSSVRNKLSIDTSLSVRETAHGIYLIDDLFVEGFPADQGAFEGIHGFEKDQAVLTQTLYFFAEGTRISDDNLANAVKVASVTIPARNGFHPSVGATDFRVLDDNPPGTYVFVTHFLGDARVAPYTSSVADTHEQYVVPSSNKPQLPPPPHEEPEPKPPTPPAPNLPPTPQTTPPSPRAVPPSTLAHTGAQGMTLAGGAALLFFGCGLALVGTRKRERIHFES